MLITLLLSSCTTTHYVSTKKIPVFVSAKERHSKRVIVEGVKEFYFWGTYPDHHIVNIDQEFKKKGVVSIANVKVEEYLDLWDSFKLFFSFGLYTPIHYRLTGWKYRPKSEDEFENESKN